jgi:hypothetical protein
MKKMMKNLIFGKKVSGVQVVSPKVRKGEYNA